MATRKPAIGERLAQARSDLETVEQRITELEATRRQALLEDDDTNAVELAKKLDGLHQAARTLRDKTALLAEQIEQEKREDAARQRAERVDEFSRKLAEADKVASRMQGTVAKLEGEFREVIRLRTEARAAWPAGGVSHINAVADTPEGCAMSPGAVRALLSYELFRTSYRPFLGGAPGERMQVSLPGSACPDMRLQGTPEKITPLAETLRRASAYALEIMQGIDNPAPPTLPRRAETMAVPETLPSPEASSPPSPVPAPQAAPQVADVNLRNVVVPTGVSRSGRTWAQLLAEQMRLASGPQNEQIEREYENVLAELAELTKEAA